MKVALTSAAIGLTLAGPMLSLPGVAGASDKRVVGEISASGLVFKVSYSRIMFVKYEGTRRVFGRPLCRGFVGRRRE